MSGNGNQVPLAPSQRGPGTYPRTSTPHRPVECYHPATGGGGAYMPNAAGGGQSSSQASLRVQPTSQSSAPPAAPQDISKNSLSGHNYVSQNQTPQPRPQYQNFQYRTQQHGTRANSHPRQQTPYIPSSPSASTGPVMYPVVFQPHMGLQTYQQPRSSTPYYQYVSYIAGYNSPPSHTPQYYYTPNSSQLSTGNAPTNTPSRSNPTTLVGAPSSTDTPTVPNTTIPIPQTPSHLHQAIPVIRPAVQKRSHRIPIINPLTKQEVLSEGDSNDNYISGDNNDRQTPQLETTFSAVEEFNRKINEVANQPYENTSKLSYITKNVELTVPVMTTKSSMQTQPNAIISNNSNINILKSDILNINILKNLGPDVAVETNDPPVVSAISDSPVIVPKMPMSNKQFQKNSDHNVQNLVLDTNKNIPHNKQLKIKNVPQIDDIERNIDIISSKSNPTAAKLGPGLPVSLPAMTMTAGAFQASAPVLPAFSQPLSTASTSPSVFSTAITSTVVTPAVTHARLPITTATATIDPTGACPVSSTHMRVFEPTPTTTAAITYPQPQPQPQRIRDHRERNRTENKDVIRESTMVKEITSTQTIPNGPMPSIPFSSVDSLSEADNTITSQKQSSETESTLKNQSKQNTPVPEVGGIPDIVKTEPDEQTSKRELHTTDCQLTATELLSASIEKLAKEILVENSTEVKEASSAIEAQVKLTQSLSSVLRTNQPETKMKDINLNNKTTDPDTANGNNTETLETDNSKEDINQNDKVLKNISNINTILVDKMTTNDEDVKDSDKFENGKDETDKIVNVEEKSLDVPEETAAVSTTPLDKNESNPVFVPKYKYSEDQWSPLNKSGKKCYDIGLLKQIKDDPLCKNKPNAPLLEACNIIRTAPLQEPQSFPLIARPNDTFFHPFAKPVISSRNTTGRDPKKDGRNMVPSSKGSAKLAVSPSGNMPHKPHIIHVSLSMREEVKLSEVDSAWKPTRFRKDNISEEQHKTDELYKKFRGILNKLTPEKFDTLLDKVKTLEIHDQKRLEGVIDLVFEKAIDEPNFSEAYAAMCNKLSMLKVPADNPTTPDQCVNFRALIINRCQKQFEIAKVDEHVLKLEKELAECNDPVKKKELQLMLEEENRRIRMRSVGNVRFIGELYKLKMLTSKIMDYCMKYLIDKVEEEKLECLCKLLTTIGEQVENETNSQIDSIFKKMQDIVDRKSNKISSRVRFMIQDVIELRKRKWVVKSVVDSQPKMMNQIQKEAEQHQRNIELMNTSPMGGSFRREDGGGRNKRGDNRRQNSNNPYMDNAWKSTRQNYSVDTSKLMKAVTPKNLNNIKLAPHTSMWNQGSGTKNTAQAVSNSMISISKNKYSVLETEHSEPTSLTANRDLTPSYHSKGASIERSTFNSRSDFGVTSARSGSVGLVRSNSGTGSVNVKSAAGGTDPSASAPTQTQAPASPSVVVPQEPLPESKAKSVKAMIDLCLINHDSDEVVAEVKQLFPPLYHASVVGVILNVALQKAAREVGMIAKLLVHLVSTGTIAPENLLAGMKDTFEDAPDSYIDIPLLYEFLGKFVSPHIEKKHITFMQIFKLCDAIISSNHGHLFLKAVITDLVESMGPTFVKSKWCESGMQLNNWMNEDQVQKWLQDNKFEFLEGGETVSDSVKDTLTPAETQSKFLQLMNSDENCECIKGWAQDKFGKSSNEDWFMRSLIQAICEYALYGPDSRDVPHFNQDRMNKYASLILEFGDSKQSREASCLFGIQQLIHRLEHPQGITLEIFQYLHEQYIISFEGFITWEESEKEPEGKGVMMKALTSFFTNIKEADNEDSCSED